MAVEMVSTQPVNDEASRQRLKDQNTLWLKVNKQKMEWQDASPYGGLLIEATKNDGLLSGLKRMLILPLFISLFPAQPLR